MLVSVSSEPGGSADADAAAVSHVSNALTRTGARLKNSNLSRQSARVNWK